MDEQVARLCGRAVLAQSQRALGASVRAIHLRHLFQLLFREHSLQKRSRTAI
ncbi:hypothetical protein CupriaWKF_33350 [Cupriavidus sp. WKF15]|uniref:hypothetical protein n=1 Tax=Cupriavidus sp. WKF15 TaxID=3032282 RepID=UPI0023E0979C|nr:hypothetical protein [Cupriavidus sp. WKF15]WER50444.1 hypothetical protein CupriaWKF_33350 [Cupriavidus sp. WKF15]